MANRYSIAPYGGPSDGLRLNSLVIHRNRSRLHFCFGHHVALSAVGTERLFESGYFRAKLTQENLIKTSPIPYTIVRATEFFEFVGDIARSATQAETVRLQAALMQPPPRTMSLQH